MPSKARIQDVVQFVTDTTTSVRNISVAATVPFLGGAAALTLSIVETLKSSQDEAIEIMEQIHEILAAVIVVYETTKIDGALPPAILSEIAKFVDSLSISMLPPAPHIFHGRESELREVVDFLKVDSPRIPILGPGGMGKTSLAQAVLHHVDIAAKYSERYFVPCHSSITNTDLVCAISAHIGFESAQSSQVIFHFETTWEPMSTCSKVEEFLSLLAGVPHLAPMITMRGAERPGKIGWTRPFPRPLIPLSDAAAHQILVDIAEDHHKPEKVQQLLYLTNNLPLAVTLMATVIGYEGCDRTISRRKEENTHLLSDGCDQCSSLDISIMLSYSGLRMTHGAQQLLSILPDGLSDADLIQSGLPIGNILACKSKLIQVSLAHVNNNQHLKSLVPVREYIQRVHPPSLNLKIPLT
ncbi:hypothetical protein C8J57DRAFT_1647360 [Mycena rebaudengoi]|nr:hypothetical protein C8J57DRAFT_1647360 [Mycena rebaudengoi]